MTDRHALVLGGGGVAGIAWMTGLLAGLADAGDDLTGADVLIGTSAGVTVAAQVGSGLALDELFARSPRPGSPPRSRPTSTWRSLPRKSPLTWLAPRRRGTRCVALAPTRSRRRRCPSRPGGP